MSNSLINSLINPFNKSSEFYNIYSRDINKYLKKIKQPLDFRPKRFTYTYTYTETLVDDLPESLKVDDIIPFSELIELDMSRNINTYISTYSTEQIDHNESVEPTEYTGVEMPKEEDYIYSYQIPSSRTVFKPYVSTPMKSTISMYKMKKPSGRRPNMPVYDDEYHKNRREYTAYKKQLMYKSMTFTRLLALYSDLPQPKFYSKFENWLVANNITDFETTKKYDSEYKLYRRNIISEKV